MAAGKAVASRAGGKGKGGKAAAVTVAQQEQADDDDGGDEQPGRRRAGRAPRPAKRGARAATVTAAYHY